MGEKILTSIIRSNESKTLGVIEPLNSTRCHMNYFLKKDENRAKPDCMFG